MSSSPIANHKAFFARMAEILAATDRFVSWWGAHRAWPANERPRICNPR